MKYNRNIGKKNVNRKYLSLFDLFDKKTSSNMNHDM